MIEQGTKQTELVNDLRSQLDVLRDKLGTINNTELGEKIGIDVQGKLQAMQDAMQQMLEQGVVHSLQEQLKDLQGTLGGLDGAAVKDELLAQVAHLDKLTQQFDIAKTVLDGLHHVDDAQKYLDEKLGSLDSPAADALLDKLHHLTNLLDKSSDAKIAKAASDGADRLVDKLQHTVAGTTPEEFEQFIHDELLPLADDMSDEIEKLKGTVYEEKARTAIAEAKDELAKMEQDGVVPTLQGHLEELDDLLQQQNDADLVEHAKTLLDQVEAEAASFGATEAGETVKEKVSMLKDIVTEWWNKDETAPLPASTPTNAPVPVASKSPAPKTIPAPAPIATGQPTAPEKPTQTPVPTPSGGSTQTKLPASALRSPIAARALIAVCGNGKQEAVELCDDGNLKSGDGCSSECRRELLLAICGNGNIESGEQCDDGNLKNGDGCSASCTKETAPMITMPRFTSPASPLTVKCGNGKIDTGEQCDDGNVNDHDGCTNACRHGQKLLKPERMTVPLPMLPKR